MQCLWHLARFWTTVSFPCVAVCMNKPCIEPARQHCDTHCHAFATMRCLHSQLHRPRLQALETSQIHRAIPRKVYQPPPFHNAAKGSHHDYTALRKHVLSLEPKSARAAAAAEASTSISQPPDGSQLSVAAEYTVNYAMNLATVAECYEVHSWMLLLGVLRQEKCTAAKVLKHLGLEDLYGAWHEVLWALNVCNGLERRAYIPDIRFQDRAYRVIRAAHNFANWGGRAKVHTQDLLLAMAAGDVLNGLFPDLNLSFSNVRKAIEQETGAKYDLPEDSEGEQQDAGDEELIKAL